MDEHINKHTFKQPYHSFTHNETGHAHHGNHNVLDAAPKSAPSTGESRQDHLMSMALRISHTGSSRDSSTVVDRDTTNYQRTARQSGRDKRQSSSQGSREILTVSSFRNNHNWSKNAWRRRRWQRK